jgi:hypothetical protein
MTELSIPPARSVARLFRWRTLPFLSIFPGIQQVHVGCWGSACTDVRGCGADSPQLSHLTLQRRDEAGATRGCRGRADLPCLRRKESNLHGPEVNPDAHQAASRSVRTVCPTLVERLTTLACRSRAPRGQQSGGQIHVAPFERGGLALPQPASAPNRTSANRVTSLVRLSASGGRSAEFSATRYAGS